MGTHGESEVLEGGKPKIKQIVKNNVSKNLENWQNLKKKK